ncbi:MAG: hypothetical protein H8F28_00700 [Fibrella sp.]|nr:hypothetical protein [Armatimonadota bacterium]
MLETDAGSRRHLLLIVGFLLCLFGGFALWGTVERTFTRDAFGGVGIGDPAPVEPDRAAFLAERRKWFQARKQMAAHGKAGAWQKAVRVADTYLARKDDTIIGLLRAEALLRLSDPQGSTAMAKLLRDDDGAHNAEADLLRGDKRAFEREAERALKSTDPVKSSPLNANNTAWLAAFTPTISDPASLAKAVALSEKAVRAARLEEAPEEIAGSLATYTNTLGGLHYRSGRDAEAIETLLESERLRTEPFNAAFLTLAYDRTGDKKAAQAWRNRLQKYLADTYATRDGQLYRHQLLLLWREIENETQE